MKKHLMIRQRINNIWFELFETPIIDEATDKQISESIKDLTTQIFECDKTMLTTNIGGVIFNRQDGPIQIQLVEYKKWPHS